MRLPLTVFLAVLSITSPVVAATIDGFRDLQWGATEDHVKSAFPGASCRTDNSPLGDWICHLQTQVNEVDVRIYIGGFTLEPSVKNGFQNYAMSFNSKDFLNIRDAFEGKYGAAGTVKTEDFVTRGRGTFQNTILEWQSDSGVRIYLAHFSGSLDRGIAIVNTNASRDESSRRRANQKAKAKKDL